MPIHALQQNFTACLHLTSSQPSPHPTYSHPALPAPAPAGNEVSVGDMADVVDGPLKGRSGTVKHIMRGFLFIQTREVAENAGFICLQARHTKV